MSCSVILLVSLVCGSTPQYRRELTLPEVEQPINQMVFLPAGDRLVTAGGRFTGLLQEPSPGELIVWDAASGRNMNTLLGHGDGVSGVALLAETHELVTGSYDGTVRTWAIKNWENTKTIEAGVGAVTAVAVSAKATQFAAAGWSGMLEENYVKIWSAATGEPVKTIGPWRDEYVALCYSPSGELIAAADRDGPIDLYKVADGSRFERLSNFGAPPISFSPRGDLLAAFEMEFDEIELVNTLAIWKTSNWTQPNAMTVNAKKLLAFCFEPSGEAIATGHADGVVMLWNLEDGTLLQKLECTTKGAVSQLQFSNSGKRLACLVGQTQVHVWSN